MNDKHFFPYIRLAMDDTIVYPFKIDRVLWDFEIIYIEKIAVVSHKKPP